MPALRLDSASALPFYRQIADQVIEHVRAGVRRPGDALPSVRALARELLVSVMTTGRAYDVLEAEGWITRRQGSGTFVADGIAEVARQEADREARHGLREAVARARRLGLPDDDIHAELRRALEGRSDG